MNFKSFCLATFKLIVLLSRYHMSSKIKAHLCLAIISLWPYLNKNMSGRDNKIVGC